MDATAGAHTPSFPQPRRVAARHRDPDGHLVLADAALVLRHRCSRRCANLRAISACNAGLSLCERGRRRHANLRIFLIRNGPERPPIRPALLARAPRKGGFPGRIWSTSGQSWPNSGEILSSHIWSNSSQTSSSPVEFGQIRVRSGRTRGTLGQARFGRIQAICFRLRVEAGQIGAMFDRCRPTFGQTPANLGRIRANFGRCRAQVGRVRARSVNSTQSSAESG